MTQSNQPAKSAARNVGQLDCTDDERDIFFRLALDMFCIVDFDGTFVQLNKVWQDTLGFTVEELQAQPFLDFVHPDDRPATVAEIEKLLAGVETVAFENRYRCKDGSYKWLLWSATASLEKQLHYAVVRDVTAHKRAEEALQESEARYRDLIESAHDLIQSVAPDGHFDFVNAAWFETLGYTESDLPDLTLLDIIHPDFHPHCQEMIAGIMAGESFKDIQVDFVAKDGRLIPVEGNATGRFIDGNYVATHAFFRDITERKEAERLSREYQQQLEREVRQRTAELVQSEKLATLGRLSAGVAHEINNPAAATQRGAGQLQEAFSQLQAIHLKMERVGLSEAQLEALLALDQRAKERAEQPDDLSPLVRSDREYEIETWLDERGVDDAWALAPALVSLGYDADRLAKLAEPFTADQLATVIVWLNCTYTIHRLLAEIGHGAFRIAEIVKALKNYTYMDRAPIQTMDLHAGLDNTLVMLHNKLKAGVAVHREYAEDLPPIQAYGSELNQVWTNIIDNAVDAMNGNGDLTLRTRRADRWVVVEIEDSGPGIPEAIRSKIFDPFFTTKPPGEGTGLGLNITHNIIVQKHKGTIAVDSQPGRTRFEIKLPIDLGSEGENSQAC